MKKITFSVVLIISSIFFVSNCYALSDADTYKITVQEMKLKDTAGTWVDVPITAQEIDIASVNAGATAAQMIGTLPLGSFVNFKLVISETMIFAGADGGFFSAAGGDATVTGNDATDASTETWVGFPPNATLTEATETSAAAGPAGEVTAHLNLDTNDADTYIEVYRNGDLATPITIGPNSVVTMSFDFDTQNTITYDVGTTVMFFLPPQSGTRFVITVDGVATTITEAQMRIDF